MTVSILVHLHSYNRRCHCKLYKYTVRKDSNRLLRLLSIIEPYGLLQLSYVFIQKERSLFVSALSSRLFTADTSYKDIHMYVGTQKFKLERIIFDW